MTSKVSSELMKDAGYQRAIKVRVRETGQVLDMVPAVARAMILGGTAEEVKPQPETMAMAGGETAVAPAQHPAHKSRRK